jgi:hypothetical protein
MVSAIHASAANTAPSRKWSTGDPIVDEFHQALGSVASQACSTLEEAQSRPRAIYQQRIDLSKSSAMCCLDLHRSLMVCEETEGTCHLEKNPQLHGYQAESS